MTASGDPRYLQEFDPAMIEWIKGFPFWRTAIWAIGVFAGLFGALALLARRRVAIALLLANFSLMVFGFVFHDLLLADGAEKYGALGLVSAAVLIGVAAFQWLYADRAGKKGYLI